MERDAGTRTTVQPHRVATPRARRAPTWMRRWLLAAAAYNLTWAAASIAAPAWMLRLLGVPTDGTGALTLFWSCIGMIIGVYGIGYAIAAHNPARHWPIVLVGLLGKVLGPVGFVPAAWRGDLPWTMGWTIVTNDLVWWIPFAMILWYAARDNQPLPPEGAVSLGQALDTLRDPRAGTLRELTDSGPTLVVLLRHAGCTFCRETLSDLAASQPAMERAGVRLAVVGMSQTSEPLRTIGERYGLTRAAWFADPERILYRALELRRGTFLQLFGPRVWARGAAAIMHGHGIGALEGDGFQMPGAFVIEGARVIRACRHATAADRPDLLELACPVI